jgi:GH15 family glucan-1,4-alpha-glucosidase
VTTRPDVTTGPDVSTERIDGFPPIEGLAAVGDGRTVALIAADGSVEWWALPVADSLPAFASLVAGDEGGRWTLAPAAPFQATRRYVEGTNVLETTFTTEEGSVRVVDSLNLSATGQLPWAELARVVHGVDGEVAMRWEVAPGDRFRTGQPWTELSHSGIPIVQLGDQTLGVVCDAAGEPEVARRRVSGSFTTGPGSQHLLAVVATDAEPLFFPAAAFVVRRAEQTVGWWRAWDERVHYEGRWQEAVRRSALVLKLLTYSETGAILAAPTTSLPEVVGGTKNYDYRFAWVRDMAFAIGAMIRLGVEEEVHKSLSWLLSTVRRTAPDVHVFYSLDGSVADSADEAPVRGYRDSRPVQSGNQAEQQTQLESFGALFDPVWAYVDQGNHLDGRTAAMVVACADRVCDIWTHPDSGLWELTDQQHYTASKVGCWTALDRAVRLADAGQVAIRHRARWEHERDAIATWVRTHCWSESKQAYTFYAGTESLDAAVLLSARIGFDRGPRMRSTIDALWSELGPGPLLYRYSGTIGQEGAFLACSFWMVEALALSDRVEEAVSLMDELVGLANDVGLYSEEMDRASRRMLGNFPQALTHLALINAAAVVEQCGGDGPAGGGGSRARGGDRQERGGDRQERGGDDESRRVGAVPAT